MIYVIYMSLFGILIGIIAVTYYGQWYYNTVIDEKKAELSRLKWSSSIRQTVEHVHWKAVDYVSEMIYTPLKNFRHEYMMPPGEIIENDEHKKHVIYDMTRELCRTIIDDKVAEIKDERHHNNPYQRILRLKIKVTKRTVDLKRNISYIYNDENNIH